jgi:hypothetical protein
MAAATKPGALHYALVLFVIIAAGEGLVIYSTVHQVNDKIAEKAKSDEELQKINKAQQRSLDQIQLLKKLIGSKFDDVAGSDNNQLNPATVAGGLTEDLKTYGKDVAAPTVIETLRRLRESYDMVAADRDSKALKIQSLEKDVLALKGQYQSQVDNFHAEAKASEQSKRTAIDEFDAKNAEKDRQARALSEQLQNVRLEFDKEKDDRERERKETNHKVTQLETLVRHQSDKIDNLEKLSFETAKGTITQVEHSNHTVLLNVGEADFVRPRMTFSVYGKENQGVGRGADDIKGKIEVIKITGPHMSIATVVDEDITRPIVAQDLIYTPIWTPGITERISVIGDIDLDNDGRNDREEFHQMLATAGCVIDNEVDDDGHRIPADGKVTVLTRFLVKGEIPDRGEAQTDEEKVRADNFVKSYKEMEDEARRNGVRVVKLSDFLAYIGFQNKRRTFLPGQHRHYDLKAGAPHPGGSAGSIDRTANGAVSKVFTKGRKGPQDVSNGATSGPSAGNDK